MQQFSELDDEIGADDWIIPEKEISRRILIKQTPRYNIYKADWYGDVIVYEPISAQQRQVHQHHHYAMTSNSTGNGIRQARFDHLELCDRLSQLDLGLAKRSKLSQSQQSLSSDQYPDSAYSSISSTPRNHTKNIKSEFEFPSGTPVLALSLSSPSTSVTGSLTIDENNNSACDAYSTPQDVCGERESWMQSTDNSERQTKHETSQLISPPTLLNRDSYNFGHVAQSASGSISDAANHQVEEVQQSSWFELNELRLIAHESFMLFMGASMDEAATTSRHNVSLVMQISQPKAVSLYNLLHATKFASSSPIDR